MQLTTLDLAVVPLPFLVGLALAGLLAYCFPRPPKSSVQGLTLRVESGE